MHGSPPQWRVPLASKRSSTRMAPKECD
jgi:hypothetical protein